MRIEAGTPLGNQGWIISDAESGEKIEHVVWVDDDLAQYRQFVVPFQVTADEIGARTVQAKRITIYPKTLVIKVQHKP